MSKHSQVSPFLGFLGLSCALSLAACSPHISTDALPSITSSPDQGDKNTVAPSALALDGKWMSTCVASSSHDGTYQATVITFTGNKFETSQNTYPDSACANEEMSISMSGTFAVTGAAAVPGNVTNGQAENVDILIQGDGGETMPLYTVFELDGGTQLFTAESSQVRSGRPSLADHSVAYTRVANSNHNARSPQ